MFFMHAVVSPLFFAGKAGARGPAAARAGSVLVNASRAALRAATHHSRRGMNPEIWEPNKSRICFTIGSKQLMFPAFETHSAQLASKSNHVCLKHWKYDIVGSKFEAHS